MKKYLILFLAVMMLMLSCNKKKSEAKIIESIVTNNKREVSCIEKESASGYTTIAGGLDWGKFYFNSDGTYMRNADSSKLAICSSSNSATHWIITANGVGTPFGFVDWAESRCNHQQHALKKDWKFIVY